jgi:ABC-2 type transport system permease protein
MKSIPVTVKQIFWSKILLNVVVILIPSLISLLMLGIAFGFGLFYYLIGIVFIIASALGVSMFGLLMNLQFPKLEYENEQEVIKQSMAAFLGVMVPMLAGMGMVGAFIATAPDQPYLFTIFLLIYIVLDLIEYALLMSAGRKKYEALI